MFFVGNDFLPHLPSLDIRDGAIDFLYNVYKRLLPTFDGYLTLPGGEVDLKKVGILLSEVGEVEDEIFYRRKLKEEEEARRKNSRKDDRQRDAQYQNVRKNREIHPVGKNTAVGGNIHHLVENTNKKNSFAAEELRQRLASKRKNPEPDETETTKITEETRMNQRPKKKLKKNDGSSVPIETNEPEIVENTITTTDGSLTNEFKSGITYNSRIENKIKLSIEKEDIVDDEEDDTSFIAITKEEEEEEEEDFSLIAITEQEVDEATIHIKLRVQQKQQQVISKAFDDLKDNVRLGERGWKDRYYSDKLKQKDINQGGGREKVYRSYIEGLCWVMKYYYQGCASWKWFYPFHYAPFASDLVRIGDLSVKFEESNPFTPIQQLLAVLPKESVAALPSACRDLIMDPNSPLAEFFPDEVPVDPNGKALPWMWVILLPFIDEKRLIDALKTVEHEFTEDEHQRNSFGPAYLFVHSSHPLYPQISNLYENETSTTIENFNGFSAILRTPSKSEKTPLNQKIIAPKTPTDYFHDISNNQVISVEYQNPKYTCHSCDLLPGAQEQPPVLEPSDVAISRCPRLNRSFTIADLGKKDLPDEYYHYHGIDKEASNRIISFSIGKHNADNSYQPNAWESTQARKYQKFQFNSHRFYNTSRHSNEYQGSSKAHNPRMTAQPFTFNPAPPPPPSSSLSLSYESIQHEVDSHPQQGVTSDQELRYQLQKTINQKKAQQFKFNGNEQRHQSDRNQPQFKQGHHNFNHPRQSRPQSQGKEDFLNRPQHSHQQQYQPKRHQPNHAPSHEQHRQQQYHTHRPHEQQQRNNYRQPNQQNQFQPRQQHPQQHPQRNGKRQRT